jgi:hypothetical protein
MRSKACILIVCVCGASLLCAQSNPPPASSPPTSSSADQNKPPASSTSTSSSSADQNKGNFVRRFSAGVTLSVLGFSLIGGGSSSVNTSSTVVTQYNTKGASGRIGYGITAQAAITDHFAISAGAFLHRIGYQFTTTVTTTTNVLQGSIVIPVTSTTSSHEDTRARLLDIPVLLRYYGKSRHTPGTRWFVEGGGAWRDVRNIKTSVDTADVNGVVSCCTFTPAQPAHRNARGIVGGTGLQLIDPLGIRVIPEFRYTRWVTDTFSNLTTSTQRNQLEASLTLSF